MKETGLSAPEARFCIPPGPLHHTEPRTPKTRPKTTLKSRGLGLPRPSPILLAALLTACPLPPHADPDLDTSPDTLAAVGALVSIAAGRLTPDGALSLVVADLHSNSAVVLLGAGDGAFRPAWSFELPQRGVEYRLAIADFNRDGIADLVITTEGSDDYEVMLGNGNGTFTYAPQLSHLKDPNSYCPT